ncbi:MAG: glycoside hydrolase family 16 protein [Clostridiales bacterium]|nr:glycoside hydrolase family 16 protein [Clostridiales bacterium]
MKKAKAVFSGILAGCMLAALAGCGGSNDQWRTNFDISLPELADAGETPNADGWYLTMYETFEEGELPQLWSYSPHGKRDTVYWCPAMVRFDDGKAVISAEYRTDHVCPDGICPSEGYFTGGIETRGLEEDGYDSYDNCLFAQAYGYFEVSVQVPRAYGMWSAFWLQTAGMNNTRNRGRDGSEIDVFESSFFGTERTQTGHCIHINGYGFRHREKAQIVDAGADLYEGFHTYAVKWSPEGYVFYIDGEATWATDYGDVSRVAEFLRLTCEIRSDEVGPYGQALGEFGTEDGSAPEFIIDSVKVYQNTEYEPYIQPHSDFRTDI